ncbi:MAG: hypothetical protein JXM73_18400 [Anaerolineae bacterium]|nr:hypothetical protein [Anaerolineae bacterium]
MSLDKLFAAVEGFRDAAHWRAAFGEPQVIGDKTLIPVAKVGYGYGLGFGHGTGEPEEEGKQAPGGEGGGGGGTTAAKPLGVIVVTPEEVYFEETADESRIAMAGILVGALFIWQFAKTLRAIFGK